MHLLNSTVRQGFALCVLGFAVSNSSAQSLAYIANRDSDNVSVVDLTSRIVVGDPIPVGSKPEAIAINSAGTRVYVANTYDSSISVIDVATNTVVATVSDVNDAHGLVLSADDQRLYAVGGASVFTIDTLTNAIVGSAIDLPTADTNICAAGAGNLAISPDGTRLYVPAIDACWDSDPFLEPGVISVIDLQQGKAVSEITVERYPTSATISADGSTVYVTNWVEGSVSVVDTTTNLATSTIRFGVNNFPINAALNSDGSQLLVANNGAGTVSVVDTKTDGISNAGILVGGELNAIAINGNANTVYVTDEIGCTLSVVDAASGSVLATIPVGSNPVGIAIARGQLIFSDGFE